MVQTARIDEAVNHIAHCIFRGRGEVYSHDSWKTSKQNKTVVEWKNVLPLTKTTKELGTGPNFVKKLWHKVNRFLSTNSTAKSVSILNCNGQVVSGYGRLIQRMSEYCCGTSSNESELKPKQRNKEEKQGSHPIVHLQAGYAAVKGYSNKAKNLCFKEGKQQLTPTNFSGTLSLRTKNNKQNSSDLIIDVQLIE
ncbi:hypothetical protein CEXT_94801 [Caerostris extrusa]|uniref:Uncharacterized protein n=1 Tax=Caerostris extrusa TaxID=172846 RepID=A0AAV4QUD1_CAEEX|nr:hypothetical protein CEXT_94801 [Caerostris extrusa]